jgi:hypothetical protein
MSQKCSLSEEMLKLIEEASQREDIQKLGVRAMFEGYLDVKDVIYNDGWDDLSERSCELIFNDSETDEDECFGPNAIAGNREALWEMMKIIKVYAYRKLFGEEY